MDDAAWIWAAVAVGSGLLFGEIAGRLVRLAFARSRGGGGVRGFGAQLGSLVFWASTSIGLVLAIAIVDASVLEELAERLSERVPRFLVGFLVLIGGWAISVTLAAMVGQSARKATGVRQIALERLLKAAIMAAAVVVALTEMGVESSMLIVLLAIGVGMPCLAIALLSVVGGREVAAQVAAGRALRHRLRIGQMLRVGNLDGEITALNPTSVEIERDDGTRVSIPNCTLLNESFSAEL